MGYGITAAGKWFGLDLGEGKDRLDFAERIELAKKLVGKRVLVKGKVEERTLDGFIKQRIKVVVVSDLLAVDTRESITLQLTGAFHVSAPITYLQHAPVVTVDGQMYVIDYEGAEGIFADAKKLDGKRVVLTGRLMGTTAYPVLCRPETMKLPTVFPTKIKAADENTLDGVQFTIQGKLKRLSEVPAIRESFVPRWSIQASGREYRLTFGNAKLTALAEKLDGKVVVLTAAFDVEECATRNALGDPVITPEADVLRVKELKAVEEDYVHETINLEIVGELKHEVLQSWPPQDLWTITVDGKTYELKFSPDVPKEKPGSLQGKRVVATGSRLDDGKLLVTGIREVTDR
jgi:hypothetical protein